MMGHHCSGSQIVTLPPDNSIDVPIRRLLETRLLVARIWYQSLLLTTERNIMIINIQHRFVLSILYHVWWYEKISSFVLWNRQKHSTDTVQLLIKKFFSVQFLIIPYCLRNERGSTIYISNNLWASSTFNRLLSRCLLNSYVSTARKLQR